MEISNPETLDSMKIICAFLLDAYRLMEGHSHLIGCMSRKRLHTYFIFAGFVQMWAVLSLLTSARFSDTSNAKILVVTPCINNIKYFIAQLMHSII